MKPQALVISHPKSLAHPLVGALLERLEQCFQLRTLTSQYAGHAVALTRQALSDFRGLVISAGGDGTLHEVVNAWAEHGFPSGVEFAPLPLGTGNDFLYSLDPRYRDLQTYLEYPLGRRIRADLGHIQYQTAKGPSQRYFCVGATAGFSAQVTAARDRISRLVPGRLAYLVAILVALSRWSRWPARLTSESGYGRDFPKLLNLNCSNVKYYGGGLISSPQADPGSGKLHAVLMSMSFLDFLRALPECFWGRFHKVKDLEQLALDGEYQLTTEQPLPVQADGEILGTTPITLKPLASVVPIVVPKLSGV